MPVRHPLAEFCAPNQELPGDRSKEMRDVALFATVETSMLVLWKSN